ncbi:hypothetical protein N752_30210 [Desulforamulus aquiferis]|nr:hypothetical protein [Desulforamulus aquiferis]RYD01272.1 hypothetical protein N752_30210 [Desulforamulus aquiferis]
MKHAIIYRHQLFKPSEIFISQQARAMQKYDPVFVGRSVLGKAPEGAKVISLAGAGSYQIYKNVVFRNAKYFERLIKPLKPALIHAHFG